MAAKKKPAKPAKKTAKTASRKPERSKGELSSEDLDSVAGGLVVQVAAPIDAIKVQTAQKIAPTIGTLPSIKDLLQ